MIFCDNPTTDFETSMNFIHWTKRPTGKTG